ncbi:MAG TPA: STM3941 family protein [Ktedonobacterales bacterium]
MRSGYPFRLYASPWKIGLLLLGSVAFVAIGYLMVLAPGARPSVWNTVIGWFALVLFGLATLVFAVQFIVLVVARQPLLEITAEGARLKNALPLRNPQPLSWSEIAWIAIYRQSSGRASAYWLAFVPRSPEFEAALANGVAPAALPPLRQPGVTHVQLNLVFLRVTPRKCEQLLAEIQTTCASEIARYSVHIEPGVQPMRLGALGA